jgi:chromosome segregation ATPase
MTFDYRKFLAENDLTATARLRSKFLSEDEEVAPQEEPTEEPAEELGDEESDAPDDLANAFSDKPGIEEPEEKIPDAKGTEKQNLRTAQADHTKMQQLLAQKDEILAKYKSGEISLDQYKTQIGNIPQEIKTLQAKLSQGLGGDEEDTDEN